MRFPELKERQFRDSWIYSRRTCYQYHYMPSLKASSIVKVDRFEVARCSSMCSRDQSPIIITLFDNFQVIANTNLELPALTLARKQLESLSVSSLIRKKQSPHNSLLYYNLYCANINNQKYFLPKFCGHKQTQPQQEIQETIPTDTKATTTAPPAHFSCFIKIAYMPNVNRPMLLYSYEKYINSFKTH
ncbi:hypothetical protein IGI04_013957 [Brassica rapa subsp. trilocularis]|uniref:Uncharacterized protein n=1 Tax=Brassica rapa subsp. trilocularis TaxID=1813537 RepID=A0ABQ7NAB4_BRACM|nr:hypothetical protein IGI04_013957 [Brassica rapa subsp. trilocularis]